MESLQENSVESGQARGRHTVPVTSSARRLLPLFAWLAALVGAIGILLLMGRGGLGTPSVLEPSAWPAWASGRDPLEVAFAVLRLVGLAAAWYLLGATTIGMVARLFRWGHLIDAADVLTVPWVRRLLQGALGLGLATAAVTGTTIGHPTRPATPDAVVAAQGFVDGGIIPISASGPGPGPTDPLEQVPPALEQAPPAVDPQVPGRAPPGPTRAYLVRPGDHMWSIAEKTLTEAWSRPPTDPEIIPYWRQLIEANRAAFVDPGNPDLILPGQTFTVPSPPPPPPPGSPVERHP